MTNNVECTEFEAKFLVNEKYEDIATGEIKYNIVIGKKEIKVHLSEINTKNSIVKLAKYGLIISQEEAKEALNELIRQVSDSRLKCLYTSSRIGLIGTNYVHPHDDSIVIDYENSQEGEYIENYQMCGTLKDWKEQVFDNYEGDAQAQFYICASFASVMLNHFNIKPFILEIFGLTSTGKSTLVKVAASVWGCNELVGSWNSTINAMEYRAAFSNIFPLFLDDTQNATEAHLKKLIYNFSSGRMRDRATATSVQEARKWYNILLSSGEFSIFNLVRDSGGTAARCISLNLDSNNHSWDFYNKVYEGIEENYGVAGYEFFKFWRDEIKNPHNTLRNEFQSIVYKLDQLASNAVTQRLSRPFAVIILAAEILNDYFSFNIDTEAFYDIFEKLSKENNSTDLVSGQLKLLLERIDTDRHFGKQYYLSNDGDLLLPVKYINDFLGKNKNVIRSAWLESGYSQGYIDQATGNIVDYKKRHTVDMVTGIAHKRNVVAINNKTINEFGYDFNSIY